MLLAALAPVALGCGSSSAAASPLDAGLPDTAHGDSAEAVAFDTPATITFLPGEARAIAVAVQPPGIHALRFALLGESLDGSLDTDTMQTNADGRTSVVLTAPRSATTFRLHATADDGPEDEIAVSVSSDGFASVVVKPIYEGNRKTPIWTASATVRSACASLPGNPSVDGPIAAASPDGSKLLLDGLPVGPTIALALRAGLSVAGCKDMKDLAAGEVRTVEVKVVDTPIDTTGLDLELAFTIDPNGNGVVQALEADVAAFANAMFPPAESQAAVLLDSMAAIAPDSADFQAARLASDWDQKLTDSLSAQPVELRDQILSWAANGLEPLGDGNVFTGRVETLGASQGHAVLHATTVGAMPAALLGIPDDTLVSLTATPTDDVQLGGSILWFPSRFVAAAADEGARNSTLNVTDAADALAGVVGCEALPALLESSGSLPQSCDEVCLRTLCVDAIFDRWTNARAASATSLQVASLTFTASAAAEVMPNAGIRSIGGTWAGTYDQGSQSVALKGTAIGSPPAHPLLMLRTGGIVAPR